ncbi:hypothetical protein [Amycolatopsis sp. lyj-109]|uniref:hypothetical protein n=1 Tax=Amycolatopsis sp. lyj-109 TaxID=2789287 RepID=UPI00397D3E56
MTKVLRTYFPGVPLDAGDAQRAAMSLHAVLQRLPGSVADLGRDLRHALTHVREAPPRSGTTSEDPGM